MLISIIKPLIVNYTILISLTVNANLLFPFKNQSKPSFREQLPYAVIGTFAAILCMFYPIEVLGETNFDLRMVIIMVLTLYRGIWAGLFCSASASIARFFIGGEFAVVGIVINLIALLSAILFKKQFMTKENRVLYSLNVLFIYLSLSLLVLEFTVPFLEPLFYLVYYVLFFATFLILVFTVEKLIEINQKIDDSLYAENLNNVSQMAAAFAHEIRNPLTAVRGFIQHLSDGKNHEQLPRYSDLILEELDRTNLIITDFLSLAKPGKNNDETIILEKVIKETIELLRPTTILKNIKVEFVTSDENEIYLNKNAFKQCLLNIIKNSIEAIENKGIRDGKITITIKKLKDKIYITIHDNGVGLNKQELEKIGLPFYTTKSKGTGLGTMVINKLIRDIGGTVKYYSEKDCWTKVEITFPFKED